MTGHYLNIFMLRYPFIFNKESVRLVVKGSHPQFESRNKFSCQRMSFWNTHWTKLVVPIVAKISAKVKNTKNNLYYVLL